MIPTSLSEAANIREVILKFKGGENIMNIHFLLPFVTYGSTTYSSNYFLVSFHTQEGGKTECSSAVFPAGRLVPSVL
jgi:hypothetical protein